MWGRIHELLDFPISGLGLKYTIYRKITRIMSLLSFEDIDCSYVPKLANIDENNSLSRAADDSLCILLFSLNETLSTLKVEGGNPCRHGLGLSAG